MQRLNRMLTGRSVRKVAAPFALHVKQGPTNLTDDQRPNRPPARAKLTYTFILIRSVFYFFYISLKYYDDLGFFFCVYNNYYYC